MTQIFAVNANNDIYLGLNGQLVIVNDVQAVLQACEHIAKALLGEMVLATDRGIPYFQIVFNGDPNFQQFESALRAAFLNVADVTAVSAITINLVGNNLNYTAVIETAYGTTGTAQGFVNGGLI